MTGQQPEAGPLVVLGQVGVLLIVASGAFVLIGATAASVLVGVVGVVLVVGTVALPVVAVAGLAVLRVKQMDPDDDGAEPVDGQQPEGPDLVEFGPGQDDAGGVTFEVDDGGGGWWR